jgi:hypothetical protein
MKTLLMLGACFVIAAPAAAANCASYTPGATELVRTLDKYQFKIKDPTNTGNSERMYLRPRNSNCTVQPVNQQGDGTHAIHDDPMCNAKKTGYFSFDVPAYSTIPAEGTTLGFRIQGTLKSYDMGVVFKQNPEKPGYVIVGALCSK